MKRGRAIRILLACILLCGVYTCFALRYYVLKPELDYDADVQMEVRPVIEEWYKTSKYHSAPALRMDKVVDAMLHPYKGERAKIPVEYDDDPRRQWAVRLWVRWKPWDMYVYFRDVRGEWRFVDERSRQ